jgi:beta-glucosidase
MTSAPYHDPQRSLEQRAASLLEALTVDEKLSMCAGQNFWQTREIPRLGLKAFKMTDGPRGVAFHSSWRRCTAFPSGIAQAASWDTDLMARFGEALAREAKSVGAQCILAPAINITRTPLNGRTFEYLSEDPLLNSRLTVSMVKAVQEQGVAACVKHFAVNNQEHNRIRVSSEVSERALQEIYLPAFKAAVEESDAWSIMAAYNSVNGVAACESEDLLQRRLRGEYGFRGFVVSDWFAVRRTSSPEACVKAGLNLEMPGKGSRYRHKNIRRSFEQGNFTEGQLDENLKGLLRVMVLTGHLDPHTNTGQRNTAEHQNLALEMAEAGITLLKNDSKLLPLDPDKTRKIAVLGPKLKKRNCLPLWGGSAGVWPPYEITPQVGLNRENKGRFEWVKSPADADAVLLFVGLSHRPGRDSEGIDRKHMDLPQTQLDLIRDTVAANPNTIVVLINGSPITMPWIEEIPAVLETWYPGMEGGTAIARTVFGDSNPSGKLPLSFPRRLEDSPAHKSPRSYPGTREVVHYDEDILVGYRHFDRNGLSPLFPFGHGLSYTEFDYTDLQLSTESLGPEETLTITMTLSNTGAVPGAEVVQLYIEDLQAEDDRPPQALKGFEKAHLAAGQSKIISFRLSTSELPIFCNRTNLWRLREGAYRVRLGSSSRDIRLEQSFVVASITGHSAAPE